jgi:lipoyl(octanoyl) transferase
MPDSIRTVHFQDLGLISYQQAWDYQEQLFNAVIAQKLHNRALEEAAVASGSRQDNHEPRTTNYEPQTTNHLLFCEHPPVITLGKTGKDTHLLMSEDWLKQRGIEFFHINRGGDITFHGPEQIVGYPILDLDNFFTDIHKYLRLLEEVIILTLAEYGIKGGRIPKATGVWIDADLPGKSRKICAMGIKCSRWVTMHGFALNVNTDLSYFNYIVPCGISDKQVTSLQRELGTKIDVNSVKEKLKRHFEQLFDAKLVINKSAEVPVQ